MSKTMQAFGSVFVLALVGVISLCASTYLKADEGNKPVGRACAPPRRVRNPLAGDRAAAPPDQRACADSGHRGRCDYDGARALGVQGIGSERHDGELPSGACVLAAGVPNDEVQRDGRGWMGVRCVPEHESGFRPVRVGLEAASAVARWQLPRRRTLRQRTPSPLKLRSPPTHSPPRPGPRNSSCWPRTHADRLALKHLQGRHLKLPLPATVFLNPSPRNPPNSLSSPS